MICVFEVTGGPALGRRFWLRSDQQMEVGRISTADFSVPTDPHMSRHHLILEGGNASFRVRDVGSANGTFVNNAKISAVELCNGDRIRAGETTFTVSVLEDDQNPHAKDGFSFSVDSGAADNAIAPLRTLDTKPRPFNSMAGEDSDLTQRAETYASSTVFRENADATMLASGGWWADFGFSLSDQPFVFEQTEEPNPESLMSDIVRRLQAEYSITAMVNVEHLGRFAKQLIGSLVEDSPVTWQSTNICSITNNRSREFRQLVDSARGQDAVILLGAKTALEQNWISNIASMVKRPSLLAELVRDPKSGVVRHMLATLDFVLFESEGSRHLNLLQRDVVELSD